MLKILNILGYISLLSLLYFIPIFMLSFDLFLQIINIVLILIFIIFNFIFFRKKKYLGIRCLVIIITLFTLSFVIYNVYGIIRGSMFKNQINQIYDEDKNAILTSEDLSNYNITYKPDKFIIDTIAKGGGKQGYIRFKNSDKYEKISYSVTISSFGSHPEHYIIVYDSNRYYFK